MEGLTASEQLLYTTVRISGLSDGTCIGMGTGFFYVIYVKNRGAICLLLTNKHVIKGCDKVELALHKRNDVGAPTEWSMVRIALLDGGVIDHPDPDVDLVGIQFDAEQLTEKGHSPFVVTLDRSLIPTPTEWNEFDALENVLMIGCPNGLYDSYNNLPIFRRGVTASHPAKRFKNADEFMIDAACFPGSSGSPVFLYDSLGYF
jgi:hypothetical protein